MKKVLGIILFIIGLLTTIAGVVIQAILLIKKYGLIFTGNTFVLHWSLFLILGIIPLIAGYMMYYYDDTDKGDD